MARNRNRSVIVRMTDDEYKSFISKTETAGTTQNQFLLNAIAENVIMPAQTAQEINENINAIYKQLKGIGTNVNQMARKANQTGNLPVMSELQNIETETAELTKGVKQLWQLSRQSTGRRRHTPE